MPLRYLLIAGLTCAVIIYIKRYRHRNVSHSMTSSAPIRMVRCRFCGVHLANREAVTLPARPGTDTSSRYYCTLEHAKQDQLTPS